jgi:hypothetical protein
MAQALRYKGLQMLFQNSNFFLFEIAITLLVLYTKIQSVGRATHSLSYKNSENDILRF